MLQLADPGSPLGCTLGSSLLSEMSTAAHGNPGPSKPGAMSHFGLWPYEAMDSTHLIPMQKGCAQSLPFAFSWSFTL